MEPVTHHVQQIIVPAYVWQDQQQRSALCTKTAQALLARADLDGFEGVGDIGDATVTPTFLRAYVVEHGDVKFVAYGFCPEDEADLVFVVMDQAVTPKADT